MDKNKLFAEAKGLVKKWAPVVGCVLAVIALIGGLCTSISVNAKLSESEKATLKSTAEWREDMAKSVANLSAGYSDMEKELSSLKSDLEAFHEEFGSSVAGIKFEAEPYPVKYAFTEKSAEEFKDFIVNVQLPITKAALEMKDEDYDKELEYIKGLSAEDLLKEFGLDSAVLGIEIVDEDIARIGGYDGAYDIKDGQFYSDGYLFGSITNEVLTFSQEQYGIPLVVNFYKEGGEVQEIGIVEKLDAMNSRIRSLSARLLDAEAEAKHLEEHYVELEEVAYGLQDRVDEHDDMIEEVAADVQDLEEYVDDTIDEGLDMIDGLQYDIDDLKEEAYAFADEAYKFADAVWQTFGEAEEYFDNTVAEAKEYFDEIISSGTTFKDDLYKTVDNLKTLTEDYLAFQENVDAFADEVRSAVKDILATFSVQQAAIMENAEDIADLKDEWDYASENLDTYYEDLELEVDNLYEDLELEVNNLYEDLELEVDKLYESIDIVTNDIESTLKAMISDNCTVLAASTDEKIQAVKAGLAEFQSRLSGLESHIASMEDKASIAYTDVVDAISELQSLASEGKALADRIAALEGFAEEYGF